MRAGIYFFTIVFIVFSNCSGPKKNEYKEKIEGFATSLKTKYGTNFQEEVQYYELNNFRDSLVGAQIGNYKFQDYYGSNVNLLEDSKPVLLESFASWCAPCISSIPALNKLSEDYPQVRFVVVAHDTPDKLKEYAKKFNSNIHVIPSEREVNASGFIKLEVGEFQSVFPFPATISISSNGKIQNVLLGAPRAGTYGGKTITLEEVHEANMMRLSRVLDKLISE